MKIYLSDINESWLVDRVRNDWYEHNMEISTQQIKEHLKKVDGVMIGRSIYQSPYMLADIEKEIFQNNKISSRQEVVERLLPYIKEETKKGTRLNQIMRHTL